MVTCTHASMHTRSVSLSLSFSPSPLFIFLSLSSFILFHLPLSPLLNLYSQVHLTPHTQCVPPETLMTSDLYGGCSAGISWRSYPTVTKLTLWLMLCHIWGSCPYTGKGKGKGDLNKGIQCSSGQRHIVHLTMHCLRGMRCRESTRTRRGTLLSNIIICCTHPQAEIIDFSRYQNCLLRDRRKENIDLSFILYTETLCALDPDRFWIDWGWMGEGCTKRD